MYVYIIHSCICWYIYSLRSGDYRAVHYCEVASIYIQPNTDRLAQNLQIIPKIISGVQEFCPWDLQLVPGNNMVLSLNPTRTVVRRVPKWKCWEIVSKFCAIQSALAVYIYRYAYIYRSKSGDYRVVHYCGLLWSADDLIITEIRDVCVYHIYCVRVCFISVCVSFVYVCVCMIFVRACIISMCLCFTCMYHLLCV